MGETDVDGDHHGGVQGLQPALRFSSQNLRASARLLFRCDFSNWISVLVSNFPVVISSG